MSFDKVEVRVFSGPDQVQVGSNTEPDLIVMNIGPKGDAGTAATITVGTTTTLAPGSSATVANAGTSSAAVFNFGIPTGATGAAGANGGSSTAWRYRAKTNATSGYPTNGHLLWNNAMQVNATEILVSHLDDEGSDIELFLSFFAEGQKLFIQNRDDSSQNQIWEITGTPTVTNPNTSTAYYTFPVTLVSSQGAEFTNNHSILFGTITEVTNSVTSATTSDGTANLSVLTLGVVPSGSITLASTNSGGFVQLSGQAATDARSIAFPNASGTLALVASTTGQISFADVSDAQTGTADLILENLTATNLASVTASVGSALIVGDGDSVKGRYDIFGNTSHFQWYSSSALYGEREFTITTENLTSSGSYSYKYPVGTGTFALTANTSGEPDKLTAGTISGATTFNTTSYAYGTGAAAAHRTALGVVEANPSTAYIVDDFAGNTTSSPTIGDLGWFSFASGGGSGALITAPATTYPNIGARVLTCGNATNAAQVVYLNNWTNLFSYNWESCFVIAASQTTDCDIICGFTKDTAALGVGKFGGISIGVRYSSATDTNWMFYSKNTNTTFAANDANNYSVSSGVAASTAYNTFRIRCASGTVEMSVNGSAWTSVTTSGITLTGAWIPYFYVSTRTTANKSGSIDYFSFKSTNLSR